MGEKDFATQNSHSCAALRAVCVYLRALPCGRVDPGTGTGIRDARGGAHWKKFAVDFAGRRACVNLQSGLIKRSFRFAALEIRSNSLVKFFSSDLVTKVKKVPVSGEDRREISKDRRREDSEPKIKLVLLVAVRGAPVPEINATKAFLLFAERLAPTHKQQRCAASCACERGETHRRRGGGAIYSQL